MWEGVGLVYIGECMVSNYQHTISMMVSNILSVCYHNCNTSQILILGGGWWVPQGERTFILVIHYLGQYHPNIILILG